MAIGTFVMDLEIFGQALMTEAGEGKHFTVMHPLKPGKDNINVTW